jgi:uncharacterized protein YdaU (DUF1376 family)
MAKDPAVLFYTSDFISGTITMTDEERGKYILLLCLQHQKGKLTERDLLSIKDMQEVYSKFEQLEDGFYYNVRMKEEAEKRKSYSASRSKNRTGKKLVKDMKNISKTYDNHMNNISSSYDKHMENENENVNKDLNKNINVNKSGNDKAITQKIIDILVDPNSELKLYNFAIEDYTELGGIDKVAEILEWDISVKEKHLKAIENVNAIK